MGKDIKKLPLSFLTTAQAAIDFASREMYGLYSKIDEDFKADKVSRDFKEEMETIIRNKIEKNNSANNVLEKEIFQRVVSEVGLGISTSADMPRLVSKYEQEIIKHEKNNSKTKTKKEKPVFDMKPSKEKRV